MIASLYQSGSSSAAALAGVIVSTGSVRCGISMAIDAQNVCLADIRIEAHVIPFPPPLVLDVVEQIADGEDLVGADTRHLDVTVLHVMRIEVDNRQEPVGSVRSRLAVSDDLAVVGLVKPQRVKELQRAVLMSDRVDAAHQLANVTGPVPVPFAELILLRVGIFFAARSERARLAQFEPAVDAVARAERGRQNQSRAKGRP